MGLHTPRARALRARAIRTVAMIAATLALGSMLGGCRWWRLGSRGSSGSYGSSESDLVVENAQQSGEMGDIVGYSAPTFQEQGYTYDGYTNVRLDSEGDDWWVMTSISISNVDLDALEPGIVYATATSGVYEGEDPQIDVLGCSGPSFGNYTFDTHAQRAELEVEDLGDGSRRVIYRAWFDRGDGDGDQLAEGSFDYRRRTVR